MRTTRSRKLMKRMLTRRDAQMEIMGIAFIVLLVSVGFLFVLSFQTQPSKPAQNPFITYSNDQLATNFLAASLKTNVCHGMTLEDLIVSCGTQSGQNCFGQFGDTDASCNEVHGAIDTMANKSLGEWQKEYIIELYYPGKPGPPDTVKTLLCNSTSDSYKPASFYVPVYGTGQTIALDVRICK